MRLFKAIMITLLAIMGMALFAAILCIVEILYGTVGVAVALTAMLVILIFWVAYDNVE